MPTEVLQLLNRLEFKKCPFKAFKRHYKVLNNLKPTHIKLVGILCEIYVYFTALAHKLCWPLHWRHNFMLLQGICCQTSSTGEMKWQNLNKWTHNNTTTCVYSRLRSHFLSAIKTIWNWTGWNLQIPCLMWVLILFGLLFGLSYYN